MITLKVINPIIDVKENRKRLKDEKFQVTKERYNEIYKALKKEFSTYLQIIAINKTVAH